MTGKFRDPNLGNKFRTSRRRLLAGMVGVGVFGALPQEARSVTPRQMEAFTDAITAFNKLGDYYLNWSQSPLWALLTDDVVVHNIHGDNEKAKGKPAVMDYFYQQIVKADNTQPCLPKTNGQFVGPTFNPTYINDKLPNKIKGTAYWVDTDGSCADLAIPFTFHFNKNLIRRLVAVSE